MYEPRHVLQRSMEGSCDNVILLLLGELDEVNRITGNSDGELRIVLGMLLCIEKCLTVEYINVEVMTALYGIAIEKTNEVIYLL